MKRYKLKRKTVVGMLIFIAGLAAAISVSYTAWNYADPENTCAQCHEVSPSHARWTRSAHAEVRCTECHGTALSNGFRSLAEKTGMVVTHIKGGKHNDDILLSEEQLLEVADNCARCHQSEYKGWLAGGHAVDYNDIFTDSVHNKTEKPYWDCLRCHGMFYEGNIHDLMTLEGEASEWKIKDGKQGARNAIPCMACHQIHTDNPVSHRYVSAKDSTRTTLIRNPKTAFYVRADKMHLRSDKLIRAEMFDNGRKVESAADPATQLCMQCHSPDYRHRAGSEDDRTVIGVHEGISCIACHNPHSNETRQSCAQCHPSLTRQQIDDVYKNPHRYVGNK